MVVDCSYEQAGFAVVGGVHGRVAVKRHLRSPSWQSPLGTTSTPVEDSYELTSSFNGVAASLSSPVQEGGQSGIYHASDSIHVKMRTPMTLVLLLGLYFTVSTTAALAPPSSNPSLRRVLEDTTSHAAEDTSTDLPHEPPFVSEHTAPEIVPHESAPTDHTPPSETELTTPPLDHSGSSSSSGRHPADVPSSKSAATSSSSDSIHEEDLSMSVTAPSASEKANSGGAGTTATHPAHRGIHFGPILLGGIGVVCVGLAVYASKVSKAKADITVTK